MTVISTIQMTHLIREARETSQASPQSPILPEQETLHLDWSRGGTRSPDCNIFVQPPTQIFH